MRLLFLCTHNACRSILCEAIFRARAAGRISVASAGSARRGTVHPLTLEQLARRGYSVDGLASKPMEALRSFAPAAVVTVCDSAAQEACPVWLGDVERVHWGLPDPTRAGLSQAQREATFDAVIATIEQRVAGLAQVDPLPEDRAGIGKLLNAFAAHS
ncbi:MAG: arsenate reductase ArsC [Pseudomonadota bacterium]